MSQIRKNPDIVISADSTIDMPPTLIQRYDIAVIASYVLLGDREEKDYPLIKQEDLFRYYNTTGQLPKTAAASPWDYQRHFAELTKKNRYVIHISKSSGISSCYQNAVSAASDFPNVWVVDSLNLSGGSGLLAREAATSAITDPEKLYTHLLKYRQSIDGSFIIETLTYLKEGGRCSSVALLGANALKLRPKIIVDNGTMHVSGKYRGSFEKCVFAYIDNQLEHLSQVDNGCVMISHSLQRTALLAQAKSYIAEQGVFAEIIDCPVSAGIACHCGPNTFGLFYVRC